MSLSAHVVPQVPPWADDGNLRSANYSNDANASGERGDMAVTAPSSSSLSALELAAAAGDAVGRLMADMASEYRH